jgi:serine/threonine protein kinase
MGKKYKLKEIIGSGSYGNVYRASYSKKIVAVKVMDIVDIAKREGNTFDKVALRIDREVDILKTIDHPYIVKLENSFLKENKYYVIMEFVPSIELVHKYGVSEKKIKKYFKQICIAVQYCHSLDPPVIHRDLKLENILVDKSDNIKIIDFGFANFEKGAALESLCGTLEYVPPELFSGYGYQGKPFDIWSLGIILYLLVAGRFPYNKDQRGNVYINNVNLDDCMCSDSCKKLILRILIIDPKMRPTIEEVLLDSWFMSKDTKKDLIKKITKVKRLQKRISEPNGFLPIKGKGIKRYISQID